MGMDDTWAAESVGACKVSVSHHVKIRFSPATTVADLD